MVNTNFDIVNKDGIYFRRQYYCIGKKISVPAKDGEAHNYVREIAEIKSRKSLREFRDNNPDLTCTKKDMHLYGKTLISIVDNKGQHHRIQTIELIE